MAYLKVNNTDYSNYVKSLKVGYETLLSEDSGRNANGDNVIDIVNRKYKVYVTFIPMPENVMYSLMNDISAYVVSIDFRNPRTKALTTITAYTSTPEPEYHHIWDDDVLVKEMNLNFIQM